ncbi:MAG: YhgE/Pip domain-containing protein [Coriobacteriales bacterium]
MHNVWTLFKSDLRHLFANVVSCIITIGLVVMPSIFAWYNLIACWDVFENTGHLTVAVANEDEGYESDLMPIRVNVGDMLVSALRGNDQIGWRIVSEDEAIDGAKSGKYYAAVVIPKEFSRDMLRFYMDDSQRAQITYYSNEKKNAISPKITMTGADTVSEKVNTVFAQSISEVMLSVAESVSRYADDMDLHGQVAALAEHVDAMSEDIDRVADVVGMYAGTLQSAQGLLDSGTELMRQASDEVGSMMDTASANAAELASVADKVEEAKGKLECALNDAQASFDELRGQVASSELGQLIGPDAQQRIDQMIADAQAKIQAVRDDYDANLKPDLDRLVSGGQGLGADASSALDGMRNAQSGISAAADSARGILGDAVSQIGSVQDDLRSSAASLHELATSISEALVMGDSAALQAILGANAQSMAQALSAPVGIERIAVFPSENFGSAMAPFYTTLAVFIGSLLILVVVKPSVSNRAQAKLRNPKPREMLIGRFGSLACISLAQTTLIGIGNIFFLHVQVVHPWLLMLDLWFSGLVFTFIIYALVLAFANLGKALTICLLIMQITGCGGSYPLQILPDFVQNVSPFLPATHTVDAMRAAMFGIYNGDFWIQLGELALFLIPAALIGFALRKPFERFMKWYVRTVESTKIIG